MNNHKRVILIILDGFGAGESDDAINFGDSGAYTSRRIFDSFPDIHAPFFKQYGLLSSHHKDVLVPQNPNKDTLSGLYELMGLVYPRLPTFPQGFSPSDIHNIKVLTGREVVGNCPKSGTQIIQELGQVHLSTGNLIIYTSQDSVLQVAAHQEVIDLSTLYFYCMLIRKYFDENMPIGRIIARPFLGSMTQGFYRTAYRKDFPYIPTKNHLLHDLKQQQVCIKGNHVVQNMFPHLLDQLIPGKNDLDCMKNLMNELSADPVQDTFYFIDLEDLDMLYAHRRDLAGYAKALEALDPYFIELKKALTPKDLLLISADHGNDPGFSNHTDHTREKVPYLILNHDNKTTSLGEIQGMSFIAQQIHQFFTS